VLSYYTPADISDVAKRIVADLFKPTFVGTVMATDRRSSTARSAHEAELDDVIAMLDLLDEKHLLSSTLFVAADLEHLPKYGPEEVNICTVVANHQKLSHNVDKLAAELDNLKSSNETVTSALVTNDTARIVDTALMSFQQRIEQFQTSVNSRIDHLNSVFSQFSQSVTSSTSTSATVNSNVLDNIDRSANLVIFGISKDRNVSIWRNKIDTVFHFILGRNVDIDDAFRMGSYRDGKVRPILVKLKSIWDRRLLLASCKKLKDFPDRVFVRPDETIDARRKKSFDWLKRKAEHENRNVVVNDGILSIDGVDVYSLRNGYIRSDHTDSHNV
jgi:prefoldin subunit 5